MEVSVVKDKDRLQGRVESIRGLAEIYGLEGIRWWPGSGDVPASLDFLVDGQPASFRDFQADLEKALGCRVAIYLADRLPEEVRDRLSSESIEMR